jgi:hypothetical protein
MRVHRDDGWGGALCSARRLMASAVLFLIVAACGDDPLAPFAPEIGNAPDNFQFQATALRGVSTVAEYDWPCSGAAANVNQATALTGGSATLVIRDAAGAEVYRRALTANGTFQTASGAAGVWRIRVQLDRASGAVNFRVQRP